MIRAVIIDDEQHCIDRLSGLLTACCSQSVQLVGTAHSVEEGRDVVQRLKPDLLFLDVELHDKSGFDLLRQLSGVRFAIIFTTAFERYAVQAFKFSAVDYLLKPIGADELQLAIGKLKDKISKDEVAQKLDVLFHNLKNIQGVSKRISVRTVQGFVVLQVSDIIRCEADVNYTHIYLKERRKLTVARTLKDFEELLEEYNFYRVHHSHLINLAYVREYNKGGYVLMLDNSEVEVSLRRRSEFLRRLASI